MKNKIAIIGNGVESATIQKLIAKKGLNDVVIVTPDEAKNIAELDASNDVRYIDMEFTRPPEINLWPNKPFVCKGKHQYRPIEKRDGNIINVEWICQCGRKL